MALETYNRYPCHLITVRRHPSRSSGATLVLQEIFLEAAFRPFASFFWTDASLLHQQRSRPFLWVSTLGVKQNRCENQSKHTPKPPQRNHQPAATRKTKAPNVNVSPALSTRGRRRNPGEIEQRRACGGVAKCEGLPDHQNHHHVATGAKKVSTESCKSKKDSKVTNRHGQVPGTQ